jgi:hypothetical protein
VQAGTSLNYWHGCRRDAAGGALTVNMAMPRNLPESEEEYCPQFLKLGNVSALQCFP